MTHVDVFIDSVVPAQPARHGPERRPGISRNASPASPESAVPEANSAGVIRERIDEQFERAGDWAKKVAGDIDWVKRLKYNQTLAVKMGVEVQVSARSDLLVRDLVHIRNALQEGIIDIGVIIVPSDRTQAFLTDRTPSLRDAIRYVEQEFPEAQKTPMVIIAVEHDGPSAAPLPKKTTNRGAKKKG